MKPRSGIAFFGAAAACCCGIASAQIAAGDYAVVTVGAQPAVWSVPAGGGTATQIQNFTAPLPGASSVEVEPTSGDLVLALPGASGTDIWRATLAGLVVTSQTLLGTLPNTAGAATIDTHLEIDAANAPTGCLLVLSAGAAGGGRIHRVSLGANSAAAFEVPFTGLGVTEFLQAITSGIDGTIYLGFNGSGPFPFPAGVYSLPRQGGALTQVLAGLPVNPRGIGVTPTNSIVVGGLGNIPPTTVSAPNYWCGAGILIAQSSFPFTPPVTDVHLDGSGASFVASVNGPIQGASGSGHLRRIQTGSCSAAAVTAVIDFADPVFKVAQRVPGKRYGCSCVVGSSTPLFTELTPPVPGTTWTARVTAALPSASVTLTAGGNNAFWGSLPIPVDLAPFGAAGSLILTSGEAFQLSVAADGTGIANYSIAVPPTLPPGITLYFQCYYFDPASPNPLNLITTNGIATST